MEKTSMPVNETDRERELYLIRGGLAMYASKLQKGDEIRVIAPSRSLSTVRKNIFSSALEYLENQGYRITFSDHSRDVNFMESASVLARIEDLHHAFLDPNVKAILTSIGGFNVNQLLEYIDYSVIENNPKIICGYSDITALLNAIYAKTGLVTYHGPYFSTFGFERNREYTNTYFEKCVGSDEEYRVDPPSEADRYEVVQEGECEGVVIGGNLCTMNLLQGTDFMPDLRDIILFLEDDNIMGEYFADEFDRNLQSLLQVKGARIAGVVLGRFSYDCNMTADVVAKIVRGKKQLQDVPVIFNADFGHVYPQITFPIGGIAKIYAKGKKAEIVIRHH